MPIRAVLRWPVAVLAALSAAGGGAPARAGEADVLAVRVACDAERRCRFEATVRHADTGWDHYADRFEVVAPDGQVLGTRVLRHPHVSEQPFTRSLAGVRVPEGVSEVEVRARDSVHGTGGRRERVEIPE